MKYFLTDVKVLFFVLEEIKWKSFNAKPGICLISPMILASVIVKFKFGTEIYSFWLQKTAKMDNLLLNLNRCEGPS